MGFIDYIPLIGQAVRGLEHEHHELKYHPEHKTKKGFHLSNIGKQWKQGFSAFAEGAVGGEEMATEDVKDRRRIEASRQPTSNVSNTGSNMTQQNHWS